MLCIIHLFILINYMLRQQHDKIYRHVKWTYITRGMQLDEVEIPTLHSVCGQPSGCEVTLFLGEIITQLKISAMSFRTYFSAKCDRKYKSSHCSCDFCRSSCDTNIWFQKAIVCCQFSNI